MRRAPVGIGVRGAAAACALLGAAIALACGGGGDASKGGSAEAPPPASPAPAAPGAIPAGQSIGSAAVTGRALFTGKAPKRRPIAMSADPGCKHPGGGEALSDDVLIGADGALRTSGCGSSPGSGRRPSPRPWSR